MSMIFPTASANSLHQQITSILAFEFAVNDLGLLHYFPGIDVTGKFGNIFLCQHTYAMDIIERAGISSCKFTSTTVDTAGKLGALDSPRW